MNTFGQKLKCLREEKKKENTAWTQTYVANQLGVARTTYTAYENDTKQPPMETILKIANLFSVTTDFLLGRVSDSNKIESSNLDTVINDPELGLWFKDIKDASPEKREELKRFWEFIMQREKNQK
ncbi:helix-turn-helix domain-containing protein [Bacillus nitratireducens]|uniref:helix-turn-helix domain-containing protein n=1 Tax=Bacillus nitratireducens TaxID=2026193 RepID=UPI000BED6F40|nr:helix-turn-helix transcriptional regulator [Bacillus nitratireducens]PEE17126.1 XRE family transcriptional regulator [Bacillus cereus]MED0903409.1 helix-turn-helix transcriptional regulator [Bacillus nitratireducens]PFH92939.1 XRE family transcriptional regulator [Bacillus cereus]PFM58521.1 XRE family transcriptional regulator [Bacillus cereus]PGS27898.1 XRE family transcriptional regulator [Bacillus cereus]